MRTNGASKNQDWPDQNGDDLSKLSMLLWYLWYVYLWVCIPMGMYTYGYVYLWVCIPMVCTLITLLREPYLGRIGTKLVLRKWHKYFYLRYVYLRYRRFFLAKFKTIFFLKIFLTKFLSKFLTNFLSCNHCEL